jgi:hypothetical protein
MSINPLVYNIPANEIESYRGRNVIIRSAVPSDIVYCLWRVDPAAIRFIQLLATPYDTSDLEACGEGVPIEIVLKDPAAEFSCLYNYTNLIDNHPVRVAMPALPGFSKAAKLAVSLSFDVKLEVGQPNQSLIEELEGVLDSYLHRTNVHQPIEFFHSALLSFFRQEPISLWEIAEEDPAQVRYITDEGQETISKRFANHEIGGDLEVFVERFSEQLVAEKRECNGCEFFSKCRGYFKWPDKSYDCAGVKRLFTTLRNAADELRDDLAGYKEPEAVEQP